MVARINDAHVTQAVLVQGAIISVLDKKGNKAFQKLIASLGGDKKRVDKTPRAIQGTKDIPTRGGRDSRVPKRPPRESTGAPPRSKDDLLG